ncbi:MAG: hypothetical protein U0992_21695 [Planctomycetaceae bacterium]
MPADDRTFVIPDQLIDRGDVIEKHALARIVAEQQRLRAYGKAPDSAKAQSCSSAAGCRIETREHFVELIVDRECSRIDAGSVGVLVGAARRRAISRRWLQQDRKASCR